MGAAAVDSPLIITVAPDSFKGSCTSVEAASAIASGVRAALGANVEVREVPMADGGEGTLETLVEAWGGRVEAVAVTDALGRARIGRVGFGGFDIGSRLAIIEAADANGLPAVSDVPLRALDADSAGVGALVLAALDTGVDEILLCIGGSATSDGGAGMLRALGARLLGTEGHDVAPGARGLRDLDAIDLTNLDPRARRTRWRIACDVENPLTGPLGAAAVFGPQKGASPDDVRVIDAGLARFAQVLAANTSDQASASALTSEGSLARTPGLGAAGGLGLGPVALFGAELVPGAQLVSEGIGLREALDGADLVITGEGRLDSQSLSGKVVSRVLADASSITGSDATGAGTNAAPVFVIAGSIELSALEVRSAGIAAAFSIADGPASLAELQGNARRLLAETAAHACGAFLAGAR